MMLITFISLRPISRTCYLFSTVLIRKHRDKDVGRFRESVSGLTAGETDYTSFAQRARGSWSSGQKGESCIEDIIEGMAFSQGIEPNFCDLAGWKLRNKYLISLFSYPMISCTWFPLAKTKRRQRRLQPTQVSFSGHTVE